MRGLRLVVAEFLWPRHDTRVTWGFEGQVAWLVTNTSKLAVCDLMGIAWRTVGAAIERVVGAFDDFDLLDGLARIGINEISHRKGYRYITVVVDFDSGYRQDQQAAVQALPA